MILVTASHFGDSSALPGFCIACAFRVCGMVISRELRNKLVLKVRLEFTRLYRRGLQPAHELVMSFSRCLLQTLNTQELLAYDANQWRPPWWNDVYFRNAFQVWPGDEWSPPGDDEEIAAFLKVKGKQNGIKERACHLFLATNLKELIATAKARQEEKCFQGLDLQSVLGRVAYACWKQLDPPKRKVYLDVAVYKMADHLENCIDAMNQAELRKAAKELGVRQKGVSVAELKDACKLTVWKRFRDHNVPPCQRFKCKRKAQELELVGSHVSELDTSPITHQQRYVWQKCLHASPGTQQALPFEIQKQWDVAVTKGPKAKHAVVNANIPKDCSYKFKMAFTTSHTEKFKKLFDYHCF